jgi:hypothetical protein
MLFIISGKGRRPRNKCLSLIKGGYFLMEGPEKVKNQAPSVCEIILDLNANLTALPLILTPF